MKTAKERREKVIEKYAKNYPNWSMSKSWLESMLEEFLTEILIAESPQGPEDIKPIKEEKIDEMGKFEVLSLEREIDVKMVDKINELVRRVNKGI